MWRRANPVVPGVTRPQGLTFIEVMVAVALLSLLLTMTYTAFFQISDGAMGIKEKLTQNQEMRLTLKLVMDDLLRARYLEQLAAARQKTGIMAKQESQPEGYFTRIDFHAATPSRFYRQLPPEQDPELHEIGYRVDRRDNMLVLLRREDFYLDDDMQKGGVEVPVAERVEKFSVEFLAPPSRRGAGSDEWLREWDSPAAMPAEKMPRALRLTLVMKTETGRQWEETLEINLPEAIKASPTTPGATPQPSLPGGRP